MAVKKHKPVTPGSRFYVSNTFAEVTTDSPLKRLTKGKSSTGGRNHDGKMTVRNMLVIFVVFIFLFLLVKN